MNEIRRHYFLDRWVIVSTGRSKRPEDFEIKEVHIQHGRCPFCPENLSSPILYRVGEPWRIAVIANKFPALDPDEPLSGRERFFHSRGGFGFHEVIIDHPEHLRFDQLTEEHLVELLGVYAQRTKTHMADKRIKYVSIFRNDGAASGASIAHIHSQLIALPVVPGTIYKERAKIDEYTHLFGECPFETIIREEGEEGSRVLMENNGFFALAPFASIFPGETWIIAKRHVRSLPELRREELEDLAAILRATVGAIFRLFPGVPYNLAVHQAPRGRDFHFHIEIYPRLSEFGGFELGNDMYINVLSPERYAAEFRRVVR